MGSEGTALIKAIQDKAVGNASLMTAVAQTGNVKKGFYYDKATPDASMPYIVFKVVDKNLNHNFCNYYVTSTVYFNIYDDSPSISTICGIKDKLTSLFDRAVLTYTGKTAIGCLRTNDGDPQNTDDGWVCTLIYNISYK